MRSASRSSTFAFCRASTADPCAYADGGFAAIVRMNIPASTKKLQVFKAGIMDLLP